MTALGDPSEKFFIGDLPVGIDEATLTTTLSRYGNVEQCTIVSPNVACVRFSSDLEAGWVVENLDGRIPLRLLRPSAGAVLGPSRGISKGSTEGSRGGRGGSRGISKGSTKGS